MLAYILIFLTVFGFASAALIALVYKRNMHFWIGSYITAQRRRVPATSNPIVVHVAVADHFEPFGGNATPELAQERYTDWRLRYPEIASGHFDSFGNHPQHTFFYPIEEYDPAALDALAEVVGRGLGDVDIHYHHDGDTAERLRVALEGFRDTLYRRHGLLRATSDGSPVPYCFVHGNWALDNSRPDGRWCGVDNELQVLVDTGCVADFTLPSAPSDTQTRTINSIYFAKGRPGRRKSHDSGRRVRVGGWAEPGELLIVQGPLGLNWSSRKFGLIPRIENGEISADAPPTAARVALWARLAPRIPGAENHLFIKLHTHGAEDPTRAALLGGYLEDMWKHLERQYRDVNGYRLRYVTAWEMYQTIRSLATGDKLDL